MQTNPQIQYNRDDDMLGLEADLINPSDDVQSDAYQDEADISAAENYHTEETATNDQVSSGPQYSFNPKKNNKLFPQIMMMCPVFLIVGLYMLIVISYLS